MSADTCQPSNQSTGGLIVTGVDRTRGAVAKRSLTCPSKPCQSNRRLSNRFHQRDLWATVVRWTSW